MTVEVEIRQATQADMAGIADLKRATWPDEEVRLDVLQHADNICHVAVTDRVVGFVDAFSTVSYQGMRRWEVDLLAVDPAYRNQGIATRLVNASTGAGQQMGAQVARCLVRAGNIPAEQVLTFCHYHAAGAGVLMTSSNVVAQRTAPPPTAHYIVVYTLAYCGIWVENDYSRESLLAGQHLCTQQRLDLVGAVIPDDAQCKVAADLGFTEVHTYQWWVQRLR